jgi:hypothetical protein
MQFYGNIDPKSTLKMTNNNDFVSIQRVLEMYFELKWVYIIFGEVWKIVLVENDCWHNYTRKNWKTRYVIFQKHMRLICSGEELKVETLSEKELEKKYAGQISILSNGESIYKLNCRKAENLFIQIPKSKKNLLKYFCVVPFATKKPSEVKKPSFSDDPVSPDRIQVNSHL